MNIKEAYEKRQRETKEETLLWERVEREKLVNKIITSFSNDQLVKAVEEKLLINGKVTVEGFGCLCQNDFCSWQKGFTAHLTDFEDYWIERGVRVVYYIKGVHFDVTGVSGSEWALSCPTLNVEDF